MKKSIWQNLTSIHLNIQKTKIMASSPTTSWQIDEETMETVTNLTYLGSKITAGEGNGNPLQYSCLENSIERGTWRATVHGVRSQRAGHDWATNTHTQEGDETWEKWSREHIANEEFCVLAFRLVVVYTRCLILPPQWSRVIIPSWHSFTQQIIIEHEL